MCVYNWRHKERSFSILDDKSSVIDGYSSYFFKSWDYIGQDVIDVV